LLTQPEDGERRILLADFGIARKVGEISGLTATNLTVGTVAYAAPEQLMGEDIDGRADQYALAATAYHLITGPHLFPHSNPAVIISRHLNAEVPKLGDTRPELANLDPVVSAALAKNPAGRFERCPDFAIALAEQVPRVGASRPAAPTTPAPVSRSAASRDDVASSTASEPSTNQRRHGRRGLLAAAAIALALVVGVALAWHPWNSHRAGSQSQKTSAAGSPSSTPVPPPAMPTVAAPVQTSAAPTLPPAEGQPVDPASTGPAEGSSCAH
jgi:serine/threonine protein kinase